MTKASERIFSENCDTELHPAFELICSTDNLVELRTAVDNGADWVKLNVCSDCFGGVGFENSSIRKGIRYAHEHHCKVLFSLEGSSLRSNWRAQTKIVERAASSGVDAFLFSDPALLLYAANHCPSVQLQYAAEESFLNQESINFYHRQFGVSRLLLPRILSMSQLEQVGQNGSIELAVFGFGKLNTRYSVCNGQTRALRETRTTAPALRAGFGMMSGDFTMSATFGNSAADESPANDLCYSNAKTFEPNMLMHLPALYSSGVKAIVAEVPLRTSTHLAQVTRVWREAIDECLENMEHYSVKPSWIATLAAKSQDRSRDRSKNTH